MSAEPAWLVVGLGNPGTKYEFTRHNAGARAVEKLGKRFDVRLRSTRAVARMGDARVDGTLLYLAVPLTYMNENGRAVAALASLKGIPPERVVIVHDDIDLPAGGLKVKIGGGSAGQKGVNSVAACLGTKDFYRVRIGIGRPENPLQPAASFVLEQLSKPAALELFESERLAGDAVLCLVGDGLEAAMNRFNSSTGNAKTEP